MRTYKVIKHGVNFLLEESHDLYHEYELKVASTY